MIPNKKLLVAAVAFLLLSSHLNAQTGYRYISAYGGYYHSRTLAAGLSVDFAKADHSTYAFFTEGYRYHTQTLAIKGSDSFLKEEYQNILLVGVLYKKLLFRSRNNSLRFLFGAAAGSSSSRDFVAAPQAGFEFTRTFTGEWELMLQQKNSYIFRAPGKNWFSGLNAGVKLPVN